MLEKLRDTALIVYSLHCANTTGKVKKNKNTKKHENRCQVRELSLYHHVPSIHGLSDCI